MKLISFNKNFLQFFDSFKTIIIIKVGGTTEHSIGDGIEFDHLFENYVAVDMNYMTFEFYIKKLKYLRYPNKFVPIESLKKIQINDKQIKLAEQLNFDLSEEVD